MEHDPVIDETHRVRREIAAEFNGEVQAFFRYLREREAKRPGSVVTLKPVVPEPVTAKK